MTGFLFEECAYKKSIQSKNTVNSGGIICINVISQPRDGSGHRRTHYFFLSLENKQNTRTFFKVVDSNNNNA